MDKILENNNQPNMGSFTPHFHSSKTKTSLRLKYEAETRVIRAKIGGLEDVRRSLGLSKRKMSQLLMVDPSAWTRWSNDEDKAPAYIYRALQWYLALIEKQPEWHPQNSFLGSNDNRIYQLEKRFNDQIDVLHSENHRLALRLKKQQKQSFLWLLGLSVGIGATFIAYLMLS